MIWCCQTIIWVLLSIMLKEYNHLILQEIHSNSKVKDKWKKDFHGQVFFSHGKANSEYNSEKSKFRI